jgi:ribosomal protein S18 acetylase RimI-like enzyme
MPTANQIEQRAIMSTHPLDNIIWQALTTSQAHFAEAFGSARRFHPEVSPLAAFSVAFSVPSQDGFDSLARLVHPGDVVGMLFTEPYATPSGWSMLRQAPLLEMVHENGALPETDSRPFDFVPLGKADVIEMLDLVKLTLPGPFNSRTHELGTYIGVRKNGDLVAMAGERLRVPGYTEISAVCTHPDHVGRGYARALMTELMNQIRARGEMSFLHVRQDNRRAITIYERLGFRERVVLHYMVLRKD